MKETQYISSDFLAPRDAWDKLSIEEQAAMMRAAISEGILDLGIIRQKYNEFAEGGNTDDDLVDWIIREEGFIANPRDIGDGKMTLGSGLTAQKWHDQYKRNGNKWTSSDNRRAVREEVANRRRWAEKNIPNWDSLPSSSQKALLSYKYNYDFNQANSPKLFKALADSNLQEAARQMDATSSNPAFKKGLQDRRQREQEWFLRDVASPQVSDITYQPAVSTQVYNPYVQQVESARVLPINEPDPNSYIRTREASPQEQRRRKFQENVEAYQRFNALMNLIDLRNNPAPSYNSIYSLFRDNTEGFAKGGKIHIKPENRGKFTALKERTGHSATWFKEHGTPAQKKMATFALNARKWKHSEGGNLYPGGGFMGLLPAIPGMALIPSSNTLNIAKAAVKGTVKGISSFITGEGEPLREAGTTFIQNLNAKNKADALDAAMHSTQGGEVMSTNNLLNVGIPNYFRKLTGRPMDINYTGSYLADGITPNTKRDLINLYLKGDTTGFEDVTDNTYYNNGPDYVKYFRENYPNIKPRTYKMSSDGVPLELSEEEYAAATKNLNKNLRMKEDSRSNADNVANFNRWYKMIGGKLYAIDSDVWDFNPKDWAWEKGDEEMANSNGTPFILKAIRPVVKKKATKKKALGGNLFSGEEELI